MNENPKAKKEVKELIKKIEDNLHPVCCTSQDYSGDMDETVNKIALIVVREKIKELQSLNNAIGITNVYLIRRLVYLNELKKEIKLKK